MAMVNCLEKYLSKGFFNSVLEKLGIDSESDAAKEIYKAAVEQKKDFVSKKLREITERKQQYMLQHIEFADKITSQIINDPEYVYLLKKHPGDRDRAIQIGLNNVLTKIDNNINSAVNKNNYEIFNSLFRDIPKELDSRRIQQFLSDVTGFDYYGKNKMFTNPEEFQFQKDIIKIVNNEQLKNAIAEGAGKYIDNINYITTDKEAQFIGRKIATMLNEKNQTLANIRGREQGMQNNYIGSMSYGVLKKTPKEKIINEWIQDIVERVNFEHPAFQKWEQGFTGDKANIKVEYAKAILDEIRNTNKGTISGQIKSDMSSFLADSKREKAYKEIVYKNLDDAIYMWQKYNDDNHSLAKNLINSIANKERKIQIHNNFGKTPFYTLKLLQDKMFFDGKAGFGTDGVTFTEGAGAIKPSQYSLVRFYNQSGFGPFKGTPNNGLTLNLMLNKFGKNATEQEMNKILYQSIKSANALGKPMANIAFMKAYLLRSLTDPLVINSNLILQGEKGLIGGFIDSATDIVKNLTTSAFYLGRTNSLQRKLADKGYQVFHANNNFLLHSFQKIIDQTNISQGIGESRVFRAAQALENLGRKSYLQELDIATKEFRALQRMSNSRLPNILKHKTFDNLKTKNPRLGNFLEEEYGFNNNTFEALGKWSEEGDGLFNILDLNGLKNISNEEKDKLVNFFYTELDRVNYKNGLATKAALYSDITPGTMDYEINKMFTQFLSWVFEVSNQFNKNYQRNLRNSIGGIENASLTGELAVLMFAIGTGDLLTKYLRDVAFGKASFNDYDKYMTRDKILEHMISTPMLSAYSTPISETTSMLGLTEKQFSKSGAASISAMASMGRGVSESIRKKDVDLLSKEIYKNSPVPFLAQIFINNN